MNKFIGLEFLLASTKEKLRLARGVIQLAAGTAEITLAEGLFAAACKDFKQLGGELRKAGIITDQELIEAKNCVMRFLTLNR
jgi:hypothetical protein